MVHLWWSMFEMVMFKAEAKSEFDKYSQEMAETFDTKVFKGYLVLLTKLPASLDIFPTKNNNETFSKAKNSSLKCASLKVSQLK